MTWVQWPGGAWLVLLTSLPSSIRRTPVKIIWECGQLCSVACLSHPDGNPQGARQGVHAGVSERTQTTSGRDEWQFPRYKMVCGVHTRRWAALLKGSIPTALRGLLAFFLALYHNTNCGKCVIKHTHWLESRSPRPGHRLQ